MRPSLVDVAQERVEVRDAERSPRPEWKKKIGLDARCAVFELASSLPSTTRNSGPRVTEPSASPSTSPERRTRIRMASASSPATASANVRLVASLTAAVFAFSTKFFEAVRRSLETS